MEVSLSPVPGFCKGQITDYDKESDKYLVHIYSSPVGPFQGEVYASYIYSPGSYGYQKNDTVRVMVYFMHDNITGEYQDSIPKMPIIIVGKFNEETMNKVDIENDTIPDDRDNNASYLHNVNKSGMVIDKSGGITFGTTTSLKRKMQPGGNGVHKDSDETYAQNFHRQIINFNPNMPAREYFGMYSGEDTLEESVAVSPDDHKIIYRRFVPADKGLEKWTSLCEGSFDPYVGGNNDNKTVEAKRDTVYSRVSENGKVRVTTEHGEPGDGFYRMRLDKVIKDELSPGPVSIPAILGNLFEIAVSDKGAFTLKAGGKGLPLSPPHGLKIEYDGKDLSISCNGKISFDHGKGTESINSFIMDPIKGIDVIAKNGFRVNEIPVLNQNFLDWFSTHKSALCQVTQVGGPAPLFPAALAEFEAKSKLPMSGKGFTTSDLGPPAKGVIITPDQFFSI